MHNLVQKKALKIRQLSRQSSFYKMKAKIFYLEYQRPDVSDEEEELNKFLSGVDVRFVTQSSGMTEKGCLGTYIIVWYEEVSGAVTILSGGKLLLLTRVEEIRWANDKKINRHIRDIFAREGIQTVSHLLTRMNESQGIRGFGLKSTRVVKERLESGGVSTSGIYWFDLIK